MLWAGAALSQRRMPFAAPGTSGGFGFALVILYLVFGPGMFLVNSLRWIAEKIKPSGWESGAGAFAIIGGIVTAAPFLWAWLFS